MLCPETQVVAVRLKNTKPHRVARDFIGARIRPDEEEFHIR